MLAPDELKPPVLRVSEGAVTDLAVHARMAFNQRPNAQVEQLRAQLAPKRVRAAEAFAPPPIPPVPVEHILTQIEAARGGGAWAAPALHGAQAIPSSIMRREEAPMMTPEQIAAADAELEAAAAPPPMEDTSAAEAAREAKRTELKKTTMMHTAQRRSLETQAEEEVAAEAGRAEDAARESTLAEAEAAALEYRRAEASEKARTEEARARLVEQVRRRAEAAGTGHMRTGRLWSDALLRRQAEEATIHARRLKKAAHAAASSELGERGSGLKSELASIRALTASVQGVLSGAA